MKCKICGQSKRLLFKKLILKKYKVDYFQCENCKLIQTEQPYWLDEAYASPMNLSDTGILVRNLLFSKIISIILLLYFDRNKAFLDFAGGYGVFTRLMRDIGFNFFWSDPYTKNVFARGFELKETKEDIEAITCLEVFEHMYDIESDLKDMLKTSSTIVFSTEIIPQDISSLSNWWYFAFEHGQHITLYSTKSLELLAKKHNLNYYSDNTRLHIFTQKKIRMMNLSLIGYVSPLLFPIIKLLFKSKTFSDHLALK